MQIKVKLIAGVEHNVRAIGRVLAVISTGVAPSIDIKVDITGIAEEELFEVKKGFKLKTPGFNGMRLKSSVNCDVDIFTSIADIELSQEGLQVTATLSGGTAGNPLVTQSNQGTLGNPLYVSGLTYSDAPATGLVNNAPVAVASVAVSIMAASGTRKEARITNLGPDACTIGAPGLTWANRCIVIQPGDSWIEDRAANLQFVAVCDTGKTASITVQQVTA